MSRVLVWLLFNLAFRFVWAILRAIGQEAGAALREAAPRVLATAGKTTDVVRQGSRVHCGQCGTRVSADLPFCPTCGLAVNLERDGVYTSPMLVHSCPSCGAATDLSDRYCTSCGSAIVPGYAGGVRPPAVEVAATLHSIAGIGTAVLTLPFAGVLVFGLAGSAGVAMFMQGVWFATLLAIVTWGVAWTTFSFATAWGLRSAKAWALHATYAVSLMWCLTAVGAVVALPLLIALMLPGSRAYFGRGAGGGASLGGPRGFSGRLVVMGRR